MLPISYFERDGNAHFNSLVVIDADGSVCKRPDILLLLIFLGLSFMLSVGTKLLLLLLLIFVRHSLRLSVDT